MLAALPGLALAACILASRTRLACWREAILIGAILWGGVLVVSTELLGAIGALTIPALAATWLVVIVGAAFVVALAARRSDVHVPYATSPPDLLTVAFVGLLGSLTAVLGALAISTAPNTWDSMTYHLARLVHWQQAGSLAPYPTHILRQLYLQPGAEFALLHLQMLSGGDQLPGLVQWLAMLGSLVGIWLIAELLGARRAGVLCTVAVAASLPIGVLEATSTQNDWVVTFWLVAAFCLALRIVQRPRPAPGWWLWIAFGTCLGLALLTKATAYLVVFPLLVWLVWSEVRRSGATALAPLLLAAAIALALNANAFARNIAVFGSPLGPSDEGAPSLRYLNDAMDPRLFVSNAVRDVGLNFVATPVVAVNVRGLGLVQTIHSLLGVAIDDPRTTWGGEQFREQRTPLAFDESFASNPLHAVLVVGAFGALWPLRRRLQPAVAPYALVLLAGGVLFAAVLRWQPWHTRLELPWFVLSAALVGLVLERLSRRVAVLAGLALLVSTLPWVAGNAARPLIGSESVFSVARADQYFLLHPAQRAAYLDAVTFLQTRQCTRVGFVSNQDGWEYPLRALDPDLAAIEHVDVANVSARAPASGSVPCAVFAVGPALVTAPIDVAGHTFRPAFVRDDVAVLLAD